MKKFIQWLARVFDAEITVEKVVEREKVIYKPVEGTMSGDVCVEGDLTVDGNIRVTGDVSCKCLKTEYKEEEL